MDKLHQLFLKRHSIRRYSDTPVEADHVRLILQAALLAPSSKSKRPWQFVVVENKDTLDLSMKNGYCQVWVKMWKHGFSYIADVTPELHSQSEKLLSTMRTK